MAPLILGYSTREADRESNFLHHPAEVSGETNTHEAAKNSSTDDCFDIVSAEVISRPEPCYHPSQKIPPRSPQSSSSAASVGTRMSEETMGAGPDAKVQILTVDFPALMKGVDVDVDLKRDLNGDRDECTDEGDDDDGLRMSSCHFPVFEPDGDKDPDDQADEDAVSEDQVNKEDKVKDTTAEDIAESSPMGNRPDASPEYDALTPPTCAPESEDTISNKEVPPTDTAEEEAAADPPRENITVLIRRKREDRLQRIELARAAESEVRRAEAVISAASRTPPPEPGPAPGPPPEPVAGRAGGFSSAPPGRRAVHARPRPRPYKRAHMLTVHWASSSAREPPPAVQQLALVARRAYGYTATHCALAPRRHAAGALAGALAEVMDEYAGAKDGDGSSDTLVIVHYVGASRTDADDFKIYPPTWPCRAPVVEVDLQSLLRDTLLSPSFPSDVLVLLDCQYACNIGGAPQAGKEILAACTEPTGFCIRTPTRDMRFTWAIARLLAQARYALHPFTDQLARALAEDGTHRRGRPARLPELAGLMVGNGPARRHILLSPVVAPWAYWVGPRGEPGSGGASSVGSGRCAGCGTLLEEGVACRCKAGPIALESREGVAADIELGEIVVGGLLVVGE